MVPKKIRFGVLGVAKINDRVFPSFARTSLAELTGIASRDAQKSAHAAKLWNIPHHFATYEELIADPAIDVIYNPLPNHLHDKYTRLAAEHGKHILCEKPLCPTAKESKSLFDFCKAKKVILMDGFMWPHHPRTKRLRDILDSGRLGKVLRAHGSFTYSMDPLDPENIRLKPEMGGGGLLDVGCYPIYGIRWAFGEEPVRVFASAQWKYGVDIEMAGVLDFADGRMATFDCGFTNPLRMNLTIVCEKGVIRIPKMWLPEPEASYNIEFSDGGHEQGTLPGADQIACMLDNMAKKVQGLAHTVPCGRNAYRTVSVMDALAKSALDHRPVEVTKWED